MKGKRREILYVVDGGIKGSRSDFFRLSDCYGEMPLVDHDVSQCDVTEPLSLNDETTVLTPVSIQ